MNIVSLFTNHDHYWGLPHERSADLRLVQTCYGCGRERLIKVELRPLYGPKLSGQAVVKIRKSELCLPVNEKAEEPSPRRGGTLIKFAALLPTGESVLEVIQK